MSEKREKRAAPNADQHDAGNATASTAANDDQSPTDEVQEAGELFLGDHEAFMRLAKENEELNERVLRFAADMENLRKRTARDVHDARAYAIAGFARDMLSVSDNLRRALDAIPAEALSSGDTGLKTLADGVEMTAREMMSALERHGVKKLEPKGSRFDPHFHQAMFEVPDDSVPGNTVVEVVQDGYVIGERMLRPAMVGVSKGGPKETATDPVEPGPPNPQAERDA